MAKADRQSRRDSLSHGRYVTALPPIKVDRRLETCLSAQVADGLRRAIRTGFYRPGDVLPPLGALMSHLGISLRVAREAIRKLTDENLVLARPRVGCKVLPKRTRCLHGRVLAVASIVNTTSYYAATLQTEIGRRLTAAGFVFESAPLFLSPSGRPDFTTLTDQLRAPVNLALALFPVPSVARRLVTARIPFVEVGTASGVRSLAHILEADYGAAEDAFVHACLERRGRRAFVLAYASDRGMAERLERAGIAVERRLIPVKFGNGLLEELEHEAMSIVLERFGAARGTRGALPDVVYAYDDFVTRGALSAFAHLGVRIPEDVGFVGFANTGFVPCHPGTLARFQMNPFSDAELVSGVLLDILNGKGVPSEIRFGPTFVPGDTFP